MMRSTITTIAAFSLFGCGGGGRSDTPSPAPAPAAAPAARQTAAPSAGAGAVEWIAVDEASRTVTIDLVAGSTDANNRWNFNGYANGEATVVVPEGYTVTVNFENRDPVNYHSVGVLERAASYPAIFDAAVPVFEGAITSNATSMTEATAPGDGTETISFTASTAGDYALVCPIPAHAVTGMWIGFEVSASGDSGLRI
ncbi:sulfocyanin-like copper-binding protein [Candidatus Palauibacter sp.]|uniref:sulfocyanin-like copper-binding protein n=1 Tax=Candidatus Palauibacter sp. TaxID=3101350 RepID=UPI003C6F0166